MKGPPPDNVMAQGPLHSWSGSDTGVYFNESPTRASKLVHKCVYISDPLYILEVSKLHPCLLQVEYAWFLQSYDNIKWKSISGTK